MRIGTTHELLRRLSDSGVLSPEQLAQVENWARREGDDPTRFGAELVQRGWLTEWQFTQLLTQSEQLLQLGPYDLLSPIASGGMGQVFKARHRRLKRLVAIKLLKRTGEDPIALQRFMREAEAAALLSHPNIIIVHDAGQDRDRHYLAMEYVEGIDLGQLVLRVGPLPVALACDYARQMALGLQHAHEHGFVHRDIKPSNALVAARPDATPEEGYSRYSGGLVKILDMGLVRHVRELATSGPLTEQGALLGTMDYLAPEQASQPTGVDGRADLYSLGCTLFYLLTARPPFAGGLPLDKILRHREEPPPRIEALREGISPALSQLLARLLAKTPAERPATAHEVAEILAPLSVEAPLAYLEARSTPGPISSGELTQRSGDLPPTRVIDATKLLPPRRFRWWMVGVVLVLVLAIYVVTLRFATPGPVPGGEHLADYIPEETTGVIECDLPRLAALEPVLPGLASKWREGLIPVIGVPPLARVRCLLDKQGVLTLSPSGETTTQLPVVSSRDLFQLDVAGRTLYLLDAPPYRLTSTDANRVRQASAYARRAARQSPRDPVAAPWPEWVRRPPEGEVPLWFSVRLDPGTLPALPDDDLRTEMSGLIEKAAQNIGLLSGWLRVNERLIEAHLEVQPRTPELGAKLLAQIEEIQKRAIDYDDADLSRGHAWSPLGKLLRTVLPEKRERTILLRRSINR
jgi:serine/threonine-protein kinase